MNSATIELLIAPFRLRAIRDLDLHALGQLFPESSVRGAAIADHRSWLRDVEAIAWGRNPRTRVVMEDNSTGLAVAGFTIDRKSEAVATLRYGFRPSNAMTQIAGFVLIRQLAFDGLNLISLRTDMVEGQDPLAQIHESIGYRQAVRLKGWWRDGDGIQHDLITYEAINPGWEARL